MAALVVLSACAVTSPENAVPLPADARRVSFGPFPPPPVHLIGDNTVYLYDQEAHSVVLIAAVSGSQDVSFGALEDRSPGQRTIGVASWDETHHYGVYVTAGTRPSTEPAVTPVKH